MDERRREKPPLGGISARASFLSATIVAALAALRHMMDNRKVICSTWARVRLDDSSTTTLLFFFLD